MFAVRALARRQVLPPLCRTNATLQAIANAVAPPPPLAGRVPSKKSTQAPAAPAPSSSASASATAKNADKIATVDAGESADGTTLTKRRRMVRRRPRISLATPRKWNPPVKKGLIPAYDEALKLIEEDSARLRSELKDIQARVEEIEKSETKGEEAEGILGELKKKVEILEIQSEINRPAVRWKAANGMADLSKPVYRHLVEQRWRKYGALDLLMERIYQMNVVPDLLPSLRPSLDLRMTFPEPPPKSLYLRTRTKRRYREVEPGVYLLPEQTRRPPRLYTSVFHPETRYYTLVLIDADVPDPENRSFTTFLHWLQPNIPLSATSPSPIPPHPHTRYIPPHPQRGSPYHRLCLFLLPHANPAEKLALTPVGDTARRGFDLRAFCAAHGLEPARGGAAHMWRTVWDETVSDIYAHTLKLPEPRYGLPPRADPYAEVKDLKKRPAAGAKQLHPASNPGEWATSRTLY